MNPFAPEHQMLYGILVSLVFAILGIRFVADRRNRDHNQATQTRLEHALLGMALLFSAPMALTPLMGSQPHFGAREALVLLTWIATLIYWSAAFAIRLEGLQIILVPVAAVTLTLSQMLPAGIHSPALSSPLLRGHLIVAMLAYGCIAFAAGLAALMHWADASMHSPKLSLSRMLPPLLALERLLFSTLWAGFWLLSATVLSGTLFSEQLFGKPLTFNHKTVFSLAAWLTFATLLWGHKVRGWRGKTAIRWTLWGFALLFLAYIGSHFVLEVLLHRQA
ncbi:cytochrome c biogenesis protein CcsA [Burkholderiaceae bacterium DAT-1]|nr:cytochrome c biogenesis protein CcsA [Burkholderiaceae bacterium DAT-1]